MSILGKSIKRIPLFLLIVGLLLAATLSLATPVLGIEYQTGTIKGKVTMAGVPLAGKYLSIWNENGSTRASTNQSGEYTQTVPIGTYTVTLWSDFFNTVKIKEYAVTVGAGETKTVDFVCTEGITGTVTRNGAPAYWAYVKAWVKADQFPLKGDASTGTDGKFYLPLPTNTYTIEVRAPNADGGFKIAEISVTVGVGQIVSLDAYSATVPTGQNVAVNLGGSIIVSFENVSQQGNISGLVTTDIPSQYPSPPSGLKSVGPCYDIETGATYSGLITIILPYPTSISDDQAKNLKLFHLEGSTWQNITTSVDTTNHTITGKTSSLSPFVISTVLSGDADYNGKVNIFDLVIVAKAFGSTPTSGNWDRRADLDGNSKVNIFDLVIVAKNFGKTL